MSDNIAGYIDRNYIKGQYYKLAGCPKPVIAGSTIDIDEISDEILSKAIYAVVGQTAGGTFPNNAIGSTFLVNTVEYGNSVYLQTATSVEAGREYTYSRIYSGGAWSTWLSADSKAIEAKIEAGEVKDMITNETDGIQVQIDSIKSISNPNSIYNMAKEAKEAADKAATNAQQGLNAWNMLSPLGNKIAIVSFPFSGTINGWSSTGPKYANITGFSSIIAVIPFCDNPGNRDQVVIPYIAGYDTSKITYKLYRPNSSDATLDKYIVKFLIFGRS